MNAKQILTASGFYVCNSLGEFNQLKQVGQAHNIVYLEEPKQSNKKTVQVKIKLLHPNAKVPTKGTEGAACYDVTAAWSLELDEYRMEYGWGFALELPEGTFLDIRPRSSIHKTGMVLSNSPGTGDEDYRGDYKSIFYNVFPALPNYKKGDRIVQVRVEGYSEIEWVVVDELSDTQRGEGGFGSTGK